MEGAVKISGQRRNAFGISNGAHQLMCELWQAIGDGDGDVFPAINRTDFE